MDIYSTRAQLAAIDLMEPEYSFLYDMFVSDMGAVEDEKAIYDYRKGKLQMAPVVHEMTGGVLMGRTATRPAKSASARLRRIASLPTRTSRAARLARRFWAR